jgi:hypothetical protein
MIELGKQYKTRDGCEARVYAVDAGGQTPVHGAIKRNGVWVVTEWTKEGCWSTGYSINNLVEVKPRIQREVWVNVYPDNLASIWTSKEKATNRAGFDRIACVKVIIDCEEGEGL